MNEELIAMRRIRKRPPTHPDAILTSGVVIQECWNEIFGTSMTCKALRTDQGA